MLFCPARLVSCTTTFVLRVLTMVFFDLSSFLLPSWEKQDHEKKKSRQRRKPNVWVWERQKKNSRNLNGNPGSEKLAADSESPRHTCIDISEKPEEKGSAFYSACLSSHSQDKLPTTESSVHDIDKWRFERLRDSLSFTPSSCVWRHGGSELEEWA